MDAIFGCLATKIDGVLTATDDDWLDVIKVIHRN